MALACCAITPATAQQDEPCTFSVMSLNVDGLPGKLLLFDVNPDGPKSEGSERISQYLATQNCDILCLQEDFNYRWEIWSRLFAGYEHDEWSGGIILEEKEVDFAHLQNLKFECDGLNMLWKNTLQVTGGERVAWRSSFGKFSHDFDDIITKGFRRRDVTLPGGQQVVVYNMHMDASSDRDEQKNNDAKDREARLDQWTQLRDYILEQLDNRPVIVTGDMNSFYHRDPVKTHFIDAINASGRATCADVWVERVAGAYPHLGNKPTEDETLDKILYINPAGGGHITPVSFTIDQTAYLHEGKPLGDHFPIIATFQFRGEQSTILQTPALQNADGICYDLSGVQQTGRRPAHGVMIFGGKKVVK